MGFKHLLINESEKKLIREMYGLLKEEKPPVFLPRVIESHYSPGYYSLIHTDKFGKHVDNEVLLQRHINDVITHLTNNKGVVARVIIHSGESIIPNYDSEGGTGPKKVGWLSTERKIKLEEYIKKVFTDLVTKKLITKIPNVVQYFDEAKTVAIPSGGWKDYFNWVNYSEEEKTKNPKNTEYDNLKKGYDIDQFSKITIKIDPDLGGNQCVFGMNIGIHYDNLNLKHICNYARYIIKANGVKLITSNGTTCGAGKDYADMNNGSESSGLNCKGKNDVGGKRMNYFRLEDPNIINQIMKASPDSNSITITMECMSEGYENGGRCHESVPHIVIKNGDKIETVNTYPQKNDAELIVIDKCGKRISGGGASPIAEDPPKGNVYSRELNFSASADGTITSDQLILNKISSGQIKKNPNNTYSVNVNFSNNGINYLVGDTIVKVSPKGQ